MEEVATTEEPTEETVQQTVEEPVELPEEEPTEETDESVEIYSGEVEEVNPDEIAPKYDYYDEIDAESGDEE